MGQRAHPRRAAQAGYRGEQALCPAVPAARAPARPPSQTWRTFLANHAHAVWAADLCTVQTLTFKTLSVLVVIAHGRRDLVHLNVTAHPTAAWVWRQLVEATAWGRRPRFLLRDRGAVYGGDFAQRAGAGRRDPAGARAGPAGEGRRFILHLIGRDRAEFGRLTARRTCAPT